MVARLIEGWESSTTAADYAGKWTSLVVGTTGSLGSSAGRNGNGLRLSGAGSPSAQRTLDAQATWVVGFACRLSALPGSNLTLLTLHDGGTTHCGLAVTSAGTLFAWRAANTTSIGTSTGVLVANTWAYLEVKATIHDTAGVFAIRVNGAEVLSLTTADTRNAGNATANSVRLGPNATPGVFVDVDDIYILDATGGVNADFLGDCRVEQVLPSGAGATTAWTPSAGSNWQCVDEVPPTGDTDYVASSTAAQTDTYACGDLAVATSGTVKCVQASVLARKDDAGSRSVALVARPGSTDRVGATQAVADSYARYAEVWNTNPDTAAAWTVGEVNASSFGQRLIA